MQHNELHLNSSVELKSALGLEFGFFFFFFECLAAFK